jgi:hypothetical protein
MNHLATASCYRRVRFRTGYDNVIAEDGHVAAVFNVGASGTDAIIKIARMKNLRSFDS